MARRNTRQTRRRARPAPRRTTRTPARRRRVSGLRWYHLVAAVIAAFCLGYLFAFGHATRYVSTVAGLR